jgi:hypothetical protein
MATGELSGPEMPPEETAERTPSGDLKKAKAEFLKKAAKLLGAVTLGIVPATAGWLDSKTEAQMALTAAATEKATNDQAYQALVERLESLEKIAAEMGEVAEEYGEELDECQERGIRHEERIAFLQRRHGVRRPPRESTVDIAATAALPEPAPPKPKGKLAELLEAAKKQKPLAKKRPRAKADMVQQVQEGYADGEF